MAKVKSAEFSKAACRAGGRARPFVSTTGRLHERDRPVRAGLCGVIALEALAAAYQITTRSLSARTIASPALQENAWANCGMLDGEAMARRLDGECGSEAR